MGRSAANYNKKTQAKRPNKQIKILINQPFMLEWHWQLSMTQTQKYHEKNTNVSTYNDVNKQ